MSTGLLLDGVFASEAIDSSGEILDVKGMDINDFDEGKGVANYEHKGHDDDKSNGEEIVGKIVFAKKIFKEGDCRNDRELMFWRKVQLPFLYGIVRLYDGAGHEGAKALAAIVRDHHANDEPIIVGFSIEGSTLDKDKATNRLTKTIARRVALTLKPCNKTAVSGLLADPNAPEGFDKTPVKPDLLAMVPMDRKTKKTEKTNPMFQRLGGSEMAYGPDVTKALTAGNYNVSPGNLTNGAALQVADRSVKARAKAAYRDWDKVTPFKKFLKSRLPEVSDEYIDHFSDLVDSHILRVKKAEEVINDLIKAGKKPLRSPKKMGVAAIPAKAAPTSDLTVQGTPVPLSDQYNKKKGAFLDNAGSMHTNRGVFPLNMVDTPHPHQAKRLISEGKDPHSIISGGFQQALADSRDAHQRAMDHWVPLNERFRTGNVSPELVSHAILFALMSPGNPVAMQEHMYSHAVDAMRSKGMGATTNAEQWASAGKDWLGRNWKPGQPGHLPEHSQEYFKRLISAVDPGDGVRGLFTKDGRVQSFGKPNQVYEYYHNYLANHHNKIMDVIRGSKGDARLVARHLTEVNGIGNKLARYTLGMIGGGNVVVPDTHLLRHIFGLQPDLQGHRPGSSPDNATFTHIRDTATSGPQANNIMDAIDKHYQANHPAVKALMNDPKLGPYFRQHPDQAVFPAFWWHWTSVPGHERLMGTPNASASNADTDHEPFWAGTADYRKNNEYDETLPVRTAMQHHRWVEQYGGMPAMKLYLQHLVPKLQANARLATGQRLVRKFEEMSVELRRAFREQNDLAKGVHPVVRKPAPAAPPPPTTVKYKDKDIKPGVMEIHDKGNVKQMAILHSSPKEFHVVPAEKVGGWDESDLARIPRYSKISEKYRVQSYPEDATAQQNTVNAQSHGLGDTLYHDDVKDFVHGLDFGAPRFGAMAGALDGSRTNTHWQKNAKGKIVYVKPAPSEYGGLEIGEPHMEATYHNLARDFFGMGKYLPKVAAVHHPGTGQAHAIIEHVPGEHFDHEDQEHQATLKAHAENGELDKMGLMNMIMGNYDRHWGNWLMDRNKGIKLIDHNVMMPGDGFVDPDPPNYWKAMHELGGTAHDPHMTALHPAAVDWAQKLDPKELTAQLQRHGVPRDDIHHAEQKLKALQRLLTKNPSVAKMTAYMHPQINLNWE